MDFQPPKGTLDFLPPVGDRLLALYAGLVEAAEPDMLERTS